MREALDALLRAASSEAPILLSAEMGSGTRALARWAHNKSARRMQRFLAFPCAVAVDLQTPPPAVTGGTLFLDEVGELPGGLQSRILHLLDDLGARNDRTRLISSTHRDLDKEVRSGRFREDLFFRLNVVEIRIPPLRERPEDIVPMAGALIASSSVELGRRAPTLSRDAAEVLVRHPWPGNQTELRNAIERALLTSPGDVLEAEAFVEVLAAGATGRPRAGDHVTLRALERAHILSVVQRASSLRDAATILGVDETTLWRRRRRYERGPG